MKNPISSLSSKVASSECSRDQPDIVEEFHLEKEEQCIAICQTYSPIPDVGCTFAAWKPSGGSGGMCTLNKEPFAMYIAHCELLSGPPEIDGCSVDDPEENSCHGIRFLDQALADCSLTSLHLSFSEKESVCRRAM